MSGETSGKMTFGQKARLAGLILALLFVVVELAINWSPVDIYYLPGHKVSAPGAIVFLVTFGLGSAAAFVYVSIRTLKKNKEAARPPASLPPASPPPTT